jgi:hypothetical protein
MSIAPRAALLVAFAALGVASVGCADLTRPDEILILAEPPPAPKAPPPPTGDELADAQDAARPAAARPRPAKKAGGG